MPGPFSLAFPFLLYFWQKKSHSLQTTLRENKYCIGHYTPLQKWYWAGALGKKTLASWSLHRSLQQCLLALLKTYPWKDTGFTVTAAAGYSGDLLRSLNLGAHIWSSQRLSIDTCYISRQAESKLYQTSAVCYILPQKMPRLALHKFCRWQKCMNTP